MKVSKTINSAGVIVFNSSNSTVLLGKATNKESLEWGLPKGSVHKGESIYNAAFRELYEETNISINDMKSLNIIFLNEALKKNYYNKKNGFFYCYVLEVNDSISLDIKCNTTHKNGELEFCDFNWFTISELSEMDFIKPQKIILEDFQKLYKLK